MDQYQDDGRMYDDDGIPLPDVEAIGAFRKFITENAITVETAAEMMGVTARHFHRLLPDMPDREAAVAQVGSYTIYDRRIIARWAAERRAKKEKRAEKERKAAERRAERERQAAATEVEREKRAAAFSTEREKRAAAFLAQEEGRAVARLAKAWSRYEKARLAAERGKEK